MSKILILFAHPDYTNSCYSRAMLEAVSSKPGVTVKMLYQLYPDFTIDVDKEQQDLVAHDVVIFQHPLYWYSCPPLLKQWIDKVLLRNFAYGKHGNATRGKRMTSVVTAGGPESTYQAGAMNEYPIREFLRMFERTAHFCKMQYDEPVIVHNTYQITEQELQQHVADYQRCVDRYLAE